MKNIYSRIDISIKSEATITTVSSYSQGLLDGLPTPGANLGCMPGICFHHSSTSAFSLIFEHLCKVSHSGIRAAPGKVFVAVHERKGKIFQDDSVMFIHKIKCRFVKEISSLVLDALMKFGKSPGSFTPGIGTFLFPGNRTLKCPELFLRVDAELRRIIELAIRSCRKVIDAKIYSGNASSRLPPGRKAGTGSQADEPFVIFPKDSNLFYCSIFRKLSVPLDADRRRLGEDKLSVLDSRSIVWTENNTVESGGWLESWKSWFLSSLHSAEKRLESDARLSHRLLKRSAIDLWIFDFAHLVQGFALTESFKGKPVHFPSVYSLLKSLVIKTAVSMENLIKHFPGCLIRVYSVFTGSHLLAFLSGNIIFHSFFRNMSCSPAIVRSASECWKPCCELFELSAEQSAGTSFEGKGNTSWCPCWITFRKQVNVIWHNLKSMYRKLIVPGGILKYFLKSRCYLAGKRFAPVPGAPNQVIFQVEYSSRVFSVLAHALYNKLPSNICQCLILKFSGGRQFLCQLNQAVPLPYFLWKKGQT